MVGISFTKSVERGKFLLSIRNGEMFMNMYLTRKDITALINELNAAGF